MLVIKEIIELVTDETKKLISNDKPIKDGGTQGGDLGRYLSSQNRLDTSIAKKARKSIGQYPVIVSNAIPNEQIFALNKKIERNIADDSSYYFE